MKVEDTQQLDPTDKVYKFTDSVKFKVEYPKDYKKTKHIKDGTIIDLHPEQAKAWEEQNLGKTVK